MKGAAPDLTPVFGERGKDILGRYVEALAKALPVEEIWLFGSCVRGTAGGNSDLDLLVVLADGHGLARPNLSCYQVINALRNRPPTDVLATSRSRWVAEQAQPFGVYGEIVAQGLRIYAKRPS